MKSGADNDDGREGRHLRHGSGAHLRQVAGEGIDDTGIEQAPADDQHGGHRDDRRMPEPKEDLIGRHQTGDKDQQQGRQGHQVIAPPTPYKKHQRRQ
jgi:hypothetical protein